MILFLIAIACLVGAQALRVNSGERARLEIALRPLVSTNHFDVPYSCPYETYFVECDSMGHITFANFAYSDLDVRGLFVELLALLRLYVNFLYEKRTRTQMVSRCSPTRRSQQSFFATCRSTQC